MKHYLLAFLLFTLPTLADPCGMVPPISLDDNDTNIQRIGEQKTYVFYKDGMETIVIHPGFSGSVDEFGMLIPFPSVPSLRKMPENVFEQVEKALNPPTVTYYRHLYEEDERADGASALTIEVEATEKQEVKVLKEEAVGMYEIAVLEAGSSSALKRWMTSHSYRFPDGMEPTCEDYIRDKWCFVAVKTRVGSQKGVDPRPGMRKADSTKPKNSVFSGKVQAMGFRFRSSKLVVPMRLSTFNEGDTNNTLYVLAEQGIRAANLPLNLVQQQVSGDKLYANLTEPLPYKIVGSTEDDLNDYDRQQLKILRNPEPHNKVAAILFASDLLANDQGTLSHDFEESEKALLDIGERFGLRGGSLDQLHSQQLDLAREQIKKSSIERVKGMTLTLIKGEFPREIIAKENIRFEPYQLSVGSVPQADQQQVTQGDLTMLILPLGLCFGLMLWKGRRQQLACALLGLMVLNGSPSVSAQDGIKTAKDWIELLDEPEQSKVALKELQSRGRAAYPYLIAKYKNEEGSVTERGYCLALLAEAPDSNVWPVVEEVALNTSSPLVKLWSQAALVKMANSPKELLLMFDAEYAKKHGDPDKNGQVMPVQADLQRPIALKLKEWEGQLSLEEQLRFLGLSNRMGRVANVSPTISNVISPGLKKAKVSDLVGLMFNSEGQEIRRLSAALLAGFQDDKRKAVFSSVMEELTVDQSAKDVPWAGGALFLPQFSSMNQSESRELITGLTRWSVWTEIHKTSEEQVRPLENNLRSYSLWTAAGSKAQDWRSAKGGKGWLAAYRKLMGPQAAKGILEDLRVSKDSPYWKIAQ